MRKIASFVGIVALLAAPAYAVQVVEYGWEDGDTAWRTILGSYLDIDASIVGAPDPVYAGEKSLKLIDQTESGTPQAFVYWVTGLEVGDVVEASFARYDDTPGSSPSGRIWGHYTEFEDDIDSYAGSAGGNSDYGEGLGWDVTAHSWTFEDPDGDRTGLVVEARTYSSPGDTVWIDDITISAPDGATIHIAPEPSSLLLLGLGVVGLIRRR